MSKKEIKEFCHTDKNLVKKYVNSLLEQTSLKLTNPQRLVIEEMFSRMNEETIMHSMNCVKFADEYIKKYNQSGHSFSKDFEISEQEMLLGMAIHDVGKTKIPKEIIEYPGKYDDEQIKIMNQHSNPINGLSIKALNECLKFVNKENHTNYTLEEIGFTTKATDISIYHHVSKLASTPNLRNYIAISCIVDVTEAATAKRGYQKNIEEFKNIDLVEKAKSLASNGIEDFYKVSKKDIEENIEKINSFVKEVATQNSRFFQKTLNLDNINNENIISFEKIKIFEKELENSIENKQCVHF